MTDGVNTRTFLGMGFGLTSLALTTTALLIQKYAAEREANLPFYKRWRFFSGLGLNLLSEVTLSPFAGYFAPISALAPMCGFGMIFNALFTHFGCVCGIREKMSRFGWLSTIMVSIGVALVALSTTNADASASGSGTISMDAMPAIMLRPAGLMLFGITFGFIFLFTLIAVVKVPVLVRLCPRNIKVNAAGLGICASACGAYSVSMLKLLTNAIGDMAEAGFQPVIVVVVILLVIIAPYQLFLLNSALGSTDATFVIPLYVRWPAASHPSFLPPQRIRSLREFPSYLPLCKKAADALAPLTTRHLCVRPSPPYSFLA